MTRLFVIACAALLVSAPARAAERGTAQSGIALHLAGVVLPRKAWDQIMDGVAAQLKQQIDAAARKENVTPPPELVAELLQDARTWVSYQEMLALTAAIYSQYYTDPELEDLMAFYGTRVGIKSILVLPQITLDINRQMTALTQQRMPRFMKKWKERLAQYGAGSPETKKTPAGK